jgi:hypothetical protein
MTNKIIVWSKCDEGYVYGDNTDLCISADISDAKTFDTVDEAKKFVEESISTLALEETISDYAFLQVMHI